MAKMGVTNHLLNGMILQADGPAKTSGLPDVHGDQTNTGAASQWAPAPPSALEVTGTQKWSPMVVVEPTHLININGSFPQVKGGNNKNLWKASFGENERISPENQWLENVVLIEMVVGRCISYWNGPFSGDI